MAKKKKNKVVQMLSPEKYIKQKARTLPIYECWINSDWEESRMAHILVSRKHVNDNITLGMYLADLNCLGIKDSFYHFNIPESEYRGIISQMEEFREMETIPYILAHNIIFAAHEFAEEYKFRPYKEFSIAKYILEEDNEAIELIEIKCGENNLPFYIQGPLDDDIRAKQIVAHLEKHAGQGNFKYILADDDLFDQDFEGDFEEEFMDIEDLVLDNNEIENSSTFQFKIQIKGITKPPVWRRITVPSYFTFLHLHHIIQAAFGWTNSHLFLFSEKGFDSKRLITQTYEDMDPDDSEFIEAEDVKLTDVFKEEKQIFTYIYDWGDNWEHKITLEKIIPEISKTPDCHAGKGKCPPEDCGSIWGYSDMKEILKDPDHSEYESYIEWLGLDNGESWDPNEFDLNFTKKILQNMFKNTEL